MKLYVCGPMTGLPGLNRSAFFEASKRLLDAGYETVNPADHVDSPDPSVPWEANVRRDIRDMLECDGLALLPYSQGSRGVALELHIARELKMPVYSVYSWIDRAERLVDAQ